MPGHAIIAILIVHARTRNESGKGKKGTLHFSRLCTQPRRPLKMWRGREDHFGGLLRGNRVIKGGYVARWLNEKFMAQRKVANH